MCVLLFTGCESQQSPTESPVAVDDTSVSVSDLKPPPGPGASADSLSSDDTSGLDGTQDDISAPVWPDDASLEAIEISATSIRLIWPFASDDTAVTSYRVALNDVQIAIALAGESTVTVPNPSMGVPLTFTVVATDAAGNLSTPLEHTTT
ncbi:MAG: fibronectin type III domain-containing protein, partial [Myxococcota bacterium]|nr:fibronectin type III domain-containing protein [Myxococcota bacterium]